MKADETEDSLEDDATKLKISKADESWVVEVKATRTSDARMTPSQARESVKQGDHFLLCVVPVHSEDDPDLDDVNQNMRFVDDIGERVSELCSRLDNFEKERGQISGEYVDGVQLIVTGGTTRISIAGFDLGKRRISPDRVVPRGCSNSGLPRSVLLVGSAPTTTQEKPTARGVHDLQLTMQLKWTRNFGPDSLFGQPGIYCNTS